MKTDRTDRQSVNRTSLPVPETVWDSTEYTYVHTAVLFLSLGSRTAIASTLAPREYDDFLNNLHQTVFNVIAEMYRANDTIAEVHTNGEEIGLYFYRPSEVFDNYYLDGPVQFSTDERREIIARCKKENSRLTFEALKFALIMKNKWLVNSINLDKVKQHHRPWDLNIGLHYGWGYLRNRADGKRRIEGSVIDIGKQVEVSSRLGTYSRIVVSQSFHDVIRSSTIKHTQLKQRIYFANFPEMIEPLSGLPSHLALFELKFVHRIGVRISDDIVRQYEAIFYRDYGNLWVYYQLAEYYAVEKRDWARVFELSKTASLVHPHDEKILLDIAQYYFETRDYEQAEIFLNRALAMNDEFDLVYEHLAVIASERRNVDQQIGYLRTAVQLSPNSAVNNYNLGLALLEGGQPEEGFRFIQEALRIYPAYPQEQTFREALLLLKRAGKLPQFLDYFLEDDPALVTQ